jgi:pimeloyl-ACP methyl ester carboxylesterase
MTKADFPIGRAAPAPGDGTGGVGIEERVEHGYAENETDGAKIHYAVLGRGPLVVMLHGFPDYWYTWRYHMAALSERHRVVALDLRGYNLSHKPEGVESYDMRLLVGDVRAVLRASGHERAIVVAHDWGGAIAWQLAMHVPEAVEKLIILNIPHPRGLARELANNPEQRKNSQYARDFQEEGAHLALTPEKLASWVADPSVRKKYIEAFERSDIEAMLNYYKRNYPREPYREVTSPLIKVQAPVLMIHGLQDPYLLPGALAGTWDWVGQGLTLVTLPDAGHFVQHDAADLVRRTIWGWLER